MVYISNGFAASAILPYGVGTIFPSALISLSIGIITFLTSQSSEKKSYKLRAKAGSISSIKTFLAGLLLPSIVIAPLLLNDWAGITYIVNLDVWGTRVIAS